MPLSLYDLRRLSPRYRAEQRRAAQQCEQARLLLASMQEQAMLLEKRLSPLSDEETLMLPAVMKPPHDFEKYTEGRIPQTRRGVLHGD